MIVYAYVHLCFAFMVRYFVSFDVDDTRFPPLWMYCGSGPRKVVSSFATRFTGGAVCSRSRSGCGTAVISVKFGRTGPHRLFADKRSVAPSELGPVRTVAGLSYDVAVVIADRVVGGRHIVFPDVLCCVHVGMNAVRPKSRFAGADSSLVARTYGSSVWFLGSPVVKSPTWMPGLWSSGIHVGNRYRCRVTRCGRRYPRIRYNSCMTRSAIL